MHHVKSRVAVCAAVSAVLLLSGCGVIRDALGGPDSADGDPGSAAGGGKAAPPVVRQVIAESGAVPAEAALTLNRLDEKSMVAEVTVTSEAESPWGSNLSGFTEFASTGIDGRYPHGYLSGLFWIGPEGRSAHMTYFNEDRSCLCTTFENTQSWGATKDAPVKAAVVLPAPKGDVDKLTVFSPFSLPFVDVPIGDKAPDLDAYGIEPPEQANGAEPEVWPLIGPSRTEDGSEDVREDSENTEVELSADVLFDLNEATLTAKADKVLDRTAARLDAGGVTEVDIAGHTDDSGDDAINEPLSKRRAETVRKALDERVDGDVDFTTKGYGSTKPIADNSTEEGARKNRRVTVSFPRPAEDAGDAAAEPGAEESQGAGGKGRPMSDFHKTVTDPEAPADKAELKGLGLDRVAADTVMVSYQMTNLRDSTERLAPFWTPPSTTVLSSIGGTSATDPGTGRTYEAMFVDRSESVGEAAASAHCACTLTSAGAMFVEYQATGTLFALLPVPESVSVLDVNLGEDLVVEKVRIEG